MKSIVEAVFTHANSFPDKLCLVDELESVTYGEYVHRIKCFANALCKYGVKRGDRVVIEASQTINYLAFELAVHLLSAIFVPTEHNCSEGKMQEIAQRCLAKLVVSEKNWTQPYASQISMRSFLNSAHSAGETVDFRFPEGTEDSEILFSTGTTGREKGIVLSHASDIALAENVIYGVEMEDDNVEIIPSPLNHSHGLRRYYANMVKGGTVLLLSGMMNMQRLFGWMDQYKVNSMDLVPAALTVLLRLSKNRIGDYRNQLRYIQFGSAPLNDADKKTIYELLPETRLYNFYGSTESGCIVIYNFNNKKDKAHCIGKPTHNVSISLIDSNGDLQEPMMGVTGLLASTGPMNMSRYWNDPEETSIVLHGDTVYTSDVIYFDEDGDIILLGRQSDVINVGGKKVSPEEIEDVARLFPGVVDCGCIPLPDAIRGQVPVLFVQVEKGAQFNYGEMRLWLRDHMEAYKIPEEIILIKKIPRSFNGKLLRRELKEQLTHEKVKVNE